MTLYYNFRSFIQFIKSKFGWLSELKVKRANLCEWVRIGELQEEIGECLDNGNVIQAATDILEIIRISIPDIDYSSRFWYDVSVLFQSVIAINAPSEKFPILKNFTEANKGGKRKKEAWDYRGRGWYFWLHTFAQKYGWDEKTIANLNIDDAVGLYQEIVLEDQMRHEWEWGLSEIAYSYDKTTKKSKLIPLPRPAWMAVNPEKKQDPEVLRVNKAFMPMGNIVDIASTSPTNPTASPVTNKNGNNK
jgi:hypothetical protein